MYLTYLYLYDYIYIYMISVNPEKYSRSMKMTCNKKYFKLKVTKKLFCKFKVFIDEEYYNVQDIFQRTSVMWLLSHWIGRINFNLLLLLKIIISFKLNIKDWNTAGQINSTL